MNIHKTATTITIILLITITIIQQHQITQLHTLTNQNKQNDIIKQYLLQNYGVETIEELIQKKLKEYGIYYTGNPFTTAIYPGQFQAENITGMHWYTYLSGQLHNRTDVLAYPSLPASYIIEGRDDDGDGVLDVVWAKNCTSGQIEFGGYWDAGGVDGSNASAVIQVTIDALTNGGEILVRQGKYLLSTMLVIKDNILLIGEGWNTVLIANHSEYVIGDQWFKDGSHTGVKNCVIANLKIDGSRQNSGGGIGFSVYSRYCKIDNCYVYNTYETCFIGSPYGVITRCKAELSRNGGGYHWSSGPGQISDCIGIDTHNSIFEFTYAHDLLLSNLIAVDAGQTNGTSASCFDFTKSYRIIAENLIGLNSIGACLNFEGGSSNISITNVIAYGTGYFLYGTGDNTEIRISNFVAYNLTATDQLVHGGGCDFTLMHGTIYGGNAGYCYFSVRNLIDCKYIGGSTAEERVNVGIQAYGNQTVVNCHIENVEQQGIIAYNADGMVLRNNRVINPNRGGYTNYLGSGIMLGASGEAVDGVIVEGNIILGAYYGISSQLTSANISNVIIKNNDLRNNAIAIQGGKFLSDNGCVIEDNFGFVTENSGTASGLADGSYIVHGLADTPTTVTLTCLNSTYDGVPVIVSWNKASTNSTHIAINIYWANGTAITDPVIAVSWQAKYQP